MNMRMIYVPPYVASEFNRPLGHPSEKPNAVELSIARVYRLISEALKDIPWPDWEVGGRRYHSLNANEPYGIECVEEKFFIYAEQRGQRSAIAVFKSAHMAADYFVWLVSDGRVQINWQLFLDMEP